MSRWDTGPSPHYLMAEYNDRGLRDIEKYSQG